MVSLLKTLSGAPRGNLDNFMKEFAERTVQHPFCRRMRILCGPDPDKHGVVFEMSTWEGAAHLHLIQSLTPGIGEGRRGMEFLKELADKHQVAVTGSLKRLGQKGLSAANLRAWYKRNGFQISTGGEMRRPVGGTQPGTRKKKSLAPG